MVKICAVLRSLKGFEGIEDWTIGHILIALRYVATFLLGGSAGSWSMSTLLPNTYAVISVAVFFGTLTCVAAYKLSPRKFAAPDKWISWGLAITIIRDHPAGRKHMPNRTHYPTLDELEAFKEGRPTKYSQEMAAARGILRRIVEKYPHAKQGNKEWIHDQYRENVIKEALDEMMLSSNDT